MAASVAKKISTKLPTLLRYCQSSGTVQNSARLFSGCSTNNTRPVGQKLLERKIQSSWANSHTCRRSLCAGSASPAEDSISVSYVNRDGARTTLKTKVGENLLDIAIDNDLEIEGYGACEGTLACSTCHLILEPKHFDMLPKPSDEELDMLDLAYALTDTSRLGCQCILTKEMDGLTVTVPEGVHDAREA